MSSAWLNPEETIAALRYLDECFGIPPRLLSDHLLMRRGEYVFAARKELVEMCDELQWVSTGLKILKVTRSGAFKPATRGIQLLGRHATRRVCELTGDQLHALVAGRSIAWGGERGFQVLKLGGIPIGVGLVRNGQLLSQLPRAVTEHLRLSGGDGSG